MSKVPLILFWLLGIIWGSNFIYMKWAAAYISTAQIVLVRVACGFVPVLLYAMARREISLKQLRHAPHFIVMSLIATSLYYYGYSKGSELLLSGVAGALSGAIPLFSWLAAVLFLPEEKFTPVRAAGIVLGFVGVVLIANPFSGSLAATNLEGVLYMVMGSFCVGLSFVYAKKFVMPLGIPSSAATAWQLGFALLILSLTTGFDGLGNILQSTHVAVGTVFGLGILGTGAAYVIYYYLIEKMGAVSASASTYIPPVVALAIGVVFVGEEITVQDYVAVALIFMGVVLVRREG